MTDHERQYELNAQTCRVIGHFLEVQRQEAKDLRQMGIIGRARAIKISLYAVQKELNELYDVQIELNSLIRDEKRQARIKALKKLLRIKQYDRRRNRNCKAL